MWTKIAHIIIKNRTLLIVLLGLVTLFMGYKATQVEMKFKLAELVPKSNDELQYFHNFQEKFGDESNVMAVGIKDSSIYQPDHFYAFGQLCHRLNQLEGIDSSGVISLPTLYYIEGKGSRRRRSFGFEPLFPASFFADSSSISPAEREAIIEEKLSLVNKLEFFKGRIYNEENGATSVLIPIKRSYVNSKHRQEVTDAIVAEVKHYEEETGIKMHMTGLPFVRSVMTGKVQEELKLFLILSLAVTAMILFIFFRSVYAVIFPVIVISIGVIWTMGTMGIFGFKISLLTGLVPPIIVVIGIPNCVYLLNKYHQEFNRHGNKIKALSTVIRKIGIVTLITNFTTAIGFLVLIAADITILKEFGVVAGINVLATFLISIILIPTVFSYLPDPSRNQLRHLKFKPLKNFLEQLSFIVSFRRKWVYGITICIVIICSWGSWNVKALSYMVDDLPEDSEVIKDLRFFEANFNGIMPLEIVVNTNDKEGYKDLNKLQKIDQFIEYLEAQPELSRSVSLVEFVKAANQALWYNAPEFYDIPSKQQRRDFANFLRRSGNESDAFQSNYIDSLGNVRISMKVADVGSKELEKLVNNRIRPAADSILNTGEHKMESRVTGTTLLFVKGNEFLIQNLRQSLIIAVFLISIIMAVLFRSVRMIIISIIPNLIPLLITGAMMGFMEIALKPSTALIFSIAFGISVDDSIHFLAKYRQELKQKFSVHEAALISIRETGTSMIYTSIILFAGFIIFSGSNFLGTVMLGILTSTTLMFAMFTNLIVLPSLLLSFDDGKYSASGGRIIDHYHNYDEDEDEEIDIDRIVKKNDEIPSYETKD